MAYSGSYTPRPMYTDAYPNFVNATTANHLTPAAAGPAFYRQQNQIQNQYQQAPSNPQNHHLPHPSPLQQQQQQQPPQLPTPQQQQQQQQHQQQSWQIYQHQQQQQQQHQHQQQQRRGLQQGQQTLVQQALVQQQAQHLLAQSHNQHQHQLHHQPQPVHPQPQSQPLQQALHQPQQSQFYPNAYSQSQPTPPPSSTSSSAPPSIQQPATGISQTHLPNQFQDFGNGRPTSMPPPSTFPNPNGLARQAYLHPQKPVDRWPPGTNEEQRQMQDQHGRPNIYFNSQNQQRQPMVTTPSPAPASTFSSPLQHPTTPPSTGPQPQPQMASLGSAFELSKPLPSPGPLSIEAQRVTALLELNSILLKEVINLQNAGKIEVPQQQQQQQQSPPVEQASVIPGSEPKKEQPSTPEEKMATTPGANQKFQVSGKLLAKDYVEYMRRLQANLAYLASIAEHSSKPQNPIPQFPAIMDPPPTEAENAKEGLRDMYLKMRELWPDYKGKA